MSILTALLLGLVQGITEFLPISSSGHLVLLQNIFNIQEADLTFDVLLHLGTLSAVVLVYRRDIRSVIVGALGLLGTGPDGGKTTKKNFSRRRMALYLLVGTLPLVLAFPLRGAVDVIYGNTALVSIMLILTGVILYLSDRFAGGIRDLHNSSLLHALLVGLAQVVAVLPGISRSGMTISMGMACGFKRSFAVRFSFLLAVPAVLGATVVSLIQALGSGLDPGMLPKYLVGMLAAAVSGYFSIRLVRYLAARSNFGGFSYYCWGAGLIALALSLIA